MHFHSFRFRTSSLVFEFGALTLLLIYHRWCSAHCPDQLALYRARDGKM